jgi:putative ABC transport system permease protein
MHDNSSVQAILDKFPQFFDNNMKIEGRDELRFDIEALPLTKIHFQSQLPYDLPVGNILSIYIFAAVAFFILIIAVINYLNLATALSTRREKEVGMRKVVGANKKQIITQFLSEALILTGISWLFSLGVLYIILPHFNKLAKKNLIFSFQSNPEIFFASIGVAFFIGVLAGVYPAFLMSSFHPVNAIKRVSLRGKQNDWLRKTLVVFQFSLTICVIIGTFIVSKQLHYIRNTNLGYSSENVMIIPMRHLNYKGEVTPLKTELKKIPSVLSVTSASELIGDKIKRNSFFIEKNGEITQVSLLWFSVDYDFLDTMNFTLKEGRNFSQEFSSDAGYAFLVNSTAVRELGWGEEALGRKIQNGFDANNNPIFQRVIGVVEDFKYGPLHNIIEPTLILLNTNSPNFLYIKLNVINLSTTIEHIKNAMVNLGISIPPSFFFLDDNLHQHYKSEEVMRKIFGIFSFLCIFISCLGLLGLSCFVVNKRKKEIGIRKVHGASEFNIVVLLSREYMKSIILANFIAWPIAYFAMTRWLQNFAYRTSFGLQPFFFSLILSFSIAFLTVSFQTIKAARLNPVNNLRAE